MATEKKPPIPLAKYARILKTIELETLYLNKGSFSVKHEKTEGTLAYSIKDTFSFKIIEDGFEAIADYSFTAKNPEKVNAIRLKAQFYVIYTTPEEITQDFFDVFKRITLPFVTWPFFREFVFSVTSRMNIPPLALPQIRQE